MHTNDIRVDALPFEAFFFLLRGCLASFEEFLEMAILDFFPGLVLETLALVGLFLLLLDLLGFAVVVLLVLEFFSNKKKYYFQSLDILSLYIQAFIQLLFSTSACCCKSNIFFTDIYKIFAEIPFYAA